MKKVTFKEVQEIRYYSSWSDPCNPYRSQLWDPGREKPEARPKLRRTVKRPFVSDVGEHAEELKNYIGRSGRRLIRRTWYHGVGCTVFDGLCINQTEFEEIDCAACIRSTFESFIRGCKHREFYVDQYGTRRCVDCKDELGQDEDPDSHEDDDPGEEDDFKEYDGTEHEMDDVDLLLNRRVYGNCCSWNIEGKWDQRPIEGK
jgi:hypothetical protein